MLVNSLIHMEFDSASSVIGRNSTRPSDRLKCGRVGKINYDDALSEAISNEADSVIE